MKEHRNLLSSCIDTSRLVTQYSTAFVAGWALWEANSGTQFHMDMLLGGALENNTWEGKEGKQRGHTQEVRGDAGPTPASGRPARCFGLRMALQNHLM